ncbi:MAG: cache domain-containing protein [Nanoarchaeota archaeon]|nr:cache domain-containing protein [Nanoarchaeota archaeon]
MKTNLLNKKLLCGMILLLFVILFSFLITDGYFTLNRDIKISSADSLDIIGQRMSSFLLKINTYPEFVGHNLMFISDLSSLKKITSSSNNNGILEDLENDFLNFLEENVVYYQLGYIDNEGNEVLKAEREDGVVELFSEENLENKKDEDYFSKTLNFERGEIFISQVVLNVDEDGEIDNLGTEENPIYLPIIFYATPTFSESGEKTGVVFLSYEADFFLDDIRNSVREGETIFLINEEGYYLAHPDREKEFAFVFGRDDNIYSDYPEISKEILLDYNKRRFETGNLIFTFRYIYPTETDFGIHKGSEKIFGKNPEESYFWVLVSVSEKEKMNETIRELKTGYIYFLLFSGLVVLIIIFLIFVAVFRCFDNKDSKEKKR